MVAHTNLNWYKILKTLSLYFLLLKLLRAILDKNRYKNIV
jgi:hypothetical protein